MSPAEFICSVTLYLLRHDGINRSGDIYDELFDQFFFLFSSVKGETSVKVLLSFRYTQ